MAARSYGRDPATNHYAVTPSNSAVLTPTPRMIYVASNGNLVVADQANTVLTYAVTAGQVLEIRPLRILTTSTANSIAWY